LFIFKARLKAHSGLCNGSRNAEDGQKDKQDGILFISKSLNDNLRINGFGGFVLKGKQDESNNNSDRLLGSVFV